MGCHKMTTRQKARIPQLPPEIWALIMWMRAEAMTDDLEKSCASCEDFEMQHFERCWNAYYAWAIYPQSRSHSPSNVVRSRWGPCWLQSCEVGLKLRLRKKKLQKFRDPGRGYAMELYWPD
eukprot:954083-Prymnesium_polylepis.2